MRASLGRPLASAEDRRVRRVIWATLGIFAAFIPFAVLVLDVQFSYTLRVVALGGALLGVVSGVLGSFAVLRQQSLMGDALSHAALPGVAVAFLAVGRQLSALLIGAAVASWLGILFIRHLTRTTRIKQDAAMGVVLSAWFALGIALLTVIQRRPDASQAGLDSFIFGQAASMVLGDVYLMAGITAVAALVLALFWKELKLVTFDQTFAEVSGVRVRLVSSLLSVLVVIAIVLGLQLAGVILMVGMLIAPGIAARQWTNRLEYMVILAGLFGAFAGSTGAVLSAIDSDVPTGPMIIVISFLIVLLSVFLAPGRGLLWTWIRKGRDRGRFAAQNARRCLYKYAVDHGDACLDVDEDFVVGVIGPTARRGLRQLERQQELKRQGDGLCLTEKGVRLGKEDRESLRLWDLYRQYSDQLNHPLVAEERHRNIGEVLPPDLIDQLHQLEARTEPVREKGIVT